MRCTKTYISRALGKTLYTAGRVYKVVTAPGKATVLGQIDFEANDLGERDWYYAHYFTPAMCWASFVERFRALDDTTESSSDQREQE